MAEESKKENSKSVGQDSGSSKEDTEIELIEKRSKQIISKLDKLVSYKHNFLRGIVGGIGTAIGATLIAGVIVAVFAAFVDTVDEFPLINDIIESTHLNDLNSSEAAE